MILPLFGLAIRGQHYKHPSTLQDCSAEMLSAGSGEGHMPVQTGPRLPPRVFIGGSRTCMFSFLCILHHNVAIIWDFSLILMELPFPIHPF